MQCGILPRPFEGIFNRLPLPFASPVGSCWLIGEATDKLADAQVLTFTLLARSFLDWDHQPHAFLNDRRHKQH